MTTIAETDHTERIGIAELMKICAQASQIFREVNLHDVGIDGFIEIALDGAATGVLIGVQVKSGDSFANKEGSRFRIQTDRSHLLYWSGCSFPVIGVIHAPSSSRTVWIDITGQSTEQRIDSGPYSLTVDYDSETVLTAESLQSKVIPLALDHLTSTLRHNEASERVERCKTRWRTSLPEPRVPTSPKERLEAWQELVDYLVSPSISLHELADVANRLSYYLPSGEDERLRILDAALGACSDHQIRRLIGAADVALEVDSYFAHAVTEVVSHIPQVEKRLEELLKADEISPSHRETAIQILEFFQEAPRDDLRRDIETGTV